MHYKNFFDLHQDLAPQSKGQGLFHPSLETHIGIE